MAPSALFRRLARVQHPVGARPARRRIVSRIRPVQPSASVRHRVRALPLSRLLGAVLRGWLAGSERPRRGRRFGWGSSRGSKRATSTDPTPSTRQWCVLCASAQRPSARPSTMTISHSGRRRSRRWRRMRKPSLQLRWPPGAGSAQVRSEREVERGVVLPLGPRQSAGARLRQALEIAGEPVRRLPGDRTLLGQSAAAASGGVEDHDRARYACARFRRPPQSSRKVASRG